MLADGYINHNDLVGGAITILKNMKVNGKDYPIYAMENKIPWFETTNQLNIVYIPKKYDII